MKLKFCKMHGLGNDFVVIDGIRQTVTLEAQRIRELGDRHFGIGFDQMLLVEAPIDHANDFRYRIFNKDGSEVEQCGNGARCFARFVLDQRLSNKRQIRVETAKGIISLQLLPNGQVTVNMGLPAFHPAAIPFASEQAAVSERIELNGRTYLFSVLSMGNPHAVLLVDDIVLAPVEEIGSALQACERFPRQVNVGFMQILTRQEISLRVYERGAGETLACGSGACAAVVAGIRRALLDTCVLVHTCGGDLTIEWPADGQAVMMTGPAATVFSGEVEV